MVLGVRWRFDHLSNVTGSGHHLVTAFGAELDEFMTISVKALQWMWHLGIFVWSTLCLGYYHELGFQNNE